MARVEIRNMADARDLRHKYREEHVAHVSPDTTAGPKSAHGVTAEGMNGIAVDLDALHQADLELERYQAKLEKIKDRAEHLAEDLHAGNTPISGPMRQLFLDRADPEGGVAGTLEDYINELQMVRDAIQDTLTSYRDLEADAAIRLAPRGVE